MALFNMTPITEILIKHILLWFHSPQWKCVRTTNRQMLPSAGAYMETSQGDNDGTGFEFPWNETDIYVSFLFMFVIKLIVLVAGLFIVGLCVPSLLLPLLLCKVMGSETIYIDRWRKRVLVEHLFVTEWSNMTWWTNFTKCMFWLTVSVGV